VLRRTSGAGASQSITYETGTATYAPASTTFASNDGGLTWTTATPLSAGTGDPTTAVAPDGRTVHVRVARDGTAPGIYVDVSG
jgi:hypothetical protein